MSQEKLQTMIMRIVGGKRGIFNYGICASGDCDRDCHLSNRCSEPRNILIRLMQTGGGGWGLLPYMG